MNINIDAALINKISIFTKECKETLIKEIKRRLDTANIPDDCFWRDTANHFFLLTVCGTALEVSATIKKNGANRRAIVDINL